jgi:parallel beta-helix repeat protein
MAEEYISKDALTGLYGGDTTATPDIWGFFKPYKNVFDKITKGTAGANEYAAAAGILGLLIPSLNKPQTAGWKGSIDLSKQYNRTPITQPAYKPYAQSASPVMGRQFFNTSYSAAPPAAPPPSIPAPATPPLTNQGLDPNSPGDSGGMARGGIAALRRFAAGGATSNAINVQTLGFGGDQPVDVKSLNELLSKSTGQSLYFPAGTYTFSSTLNIPSNITLMGDGSGKTIFLADKDYDPNASLVKAQSQASAININGITFDGGDNPRKGTSALVELGYTSDLNFTNSAVQNTQYIGLDLGGAQNATVQGSLFTNIGNPNHSVNGGSAIYVGGEGENQAKNINVVGNTFKDNNWSAAYFMPDGGQFSNNTCVNNGESTLFMNHTGKNVTIANNTIDGSRRMDISASGLELGGQNLKVYGNTITNAGSDGITLTDVSNSQIENNNLFNNGRESQKYEPFQYAAGIGVNSSTQNANNVVQNNTIYDNQTNPTQQYGVFGWSQNQGAGWAAVKLPTTPCMALRVIICMT